MSKSQEAVQEPDSDEVQEDSTVAKPYTECKLICQVGGGNARSPGSSSPKKASESNMPQDFKKPICNNAKPLGSSTSRKASKPESVEKSSAAFPPTPKKLRLEQNLLGKHGDTIPLGSSTKSEEGKLHKTEGIQKGSVVPAAPPIKLRQDLVASQKNDLSCFVRRSSANALDKISSEKAHKQREPEDTRKPIAQTAALQSVLKEQNKTKSSTKAEKQSNCVAPERPKKTRSVAQERGKRKEYACFSVWANIYESECSSGSAEPLVNKRTERRKRERERAAEEEVSSEQVKPPA